jgi:hypothetical protein
LPSGLGGFGFKLNKYNLAVIEELRGDTTEYKNPQDGIAC